MRRSLFEYQDQANWIDIGKQRIEIPEPGCNNLVYDMNSSLGTYYSIGETANHYYRGATNTSNYNNFSGTICKIVAKLSKTSGDIGNGIIGKTFRMRVWSKTGSTDVDGDLDEELATSNPVTGNSDWNQTDVPFTFPSPYTFASGSPNNYAVTLDMGEVDGDNFASWDGSNADDFTTYWGWARWTSAGVAQSYGYDDVNTEFYSE